jgi:hypothetical protein
MVILIKREHKLKLLKIEDNTKEVSTVLINPKK